MIHEGSHVREMEAKGIRTALGNLNLRISQFKRSIRIWIKLNSPEFYLYSFVAYLYELESGANCELRPCTGCH